MGTSTHGEPEGSRFRAVLDLTGVESGQPRLAVDLGLDAPVAEDSPLAGPLALVRGAIGLLTGVQNSERGREQDHRQAERQLTGRPRPATPARTPRSPKRGRGGREPGLHR